MREKIIIASGPVIVEEGKLLVTRDDKDAFYKIPGGRIEEGESLEETCYREAREELGAEIEIIRPLNPMIVYKDQQTGEPVIIVLIHYAARLKNITQLHVSPPIQEIAWLDIEEIKAGKYQVSNNIIFLIQKGDIQ